MAPGARNKFGAPIFESKAFRKQLHCIEESSCDIVGTFRCSLVIRRPGHCPPPVTNLLVGKRFASALSTILRAPVPTNS